MKIFSLFLLIFCAIGISFSLVASTEATLEHSVSSVSKYSKDVETVENLTLERARGDLVSRNLNYKLAKKKITRDTFLDKLGTISKKP